MVTAISTLQRMGAQIEINDDWISAHAPNGPRAVALHTDTHPGFMTDCPSPLFVLMTPAARMSVRPEPVFESSIRYPAPALQTMGGPNDQFETRLGANGSAPG